MTALLNCVCGNDTIEEVLANPGQNIDKLEFGFEFGTWTVAPYFDFFDFVLEQPFKVNSGATYFSPEQIEKIKNALKVLVENFVQEKVDPVDKYEKELLNIIKDYRNKDNELNPFCSYVKELMVLGSTNPLSLNSVDWYKKLLSIFSCNRVAIIML